LKIDSQQRAIAPCVDLLVSVCSRWWPETSDSQLELVLDEAIRNAYEHGNLGISSDEKTRLLESDAFEDELARRENLADVEAKKIHIDVSCTKVKFVLTLRDEGAGFDWRSYRGDAAEQASSRDGLHGRGLVLLNKIFDSVSYNDSGNEVTLVRNLKPKNG
jgi:anti-sigma regulatory factor (Ser/Thr protein kinase)